MKNPSYDRKHSKASKKKRSPKKKAVAKPLEEEEVVWFSNPSKQAARARREEAKDIMGRELWNTIMEDSSDDEDDEEFYFYDGGWHNSPQQPHVHLETPIGKADSCCREEEVDSSQGFEVGEACSHNDVFCATMRGVPNIKVDEDSAVAVRNDVMDMEPQMTETQTKSDTVVEIDDKVEEESHPIGDASNKVIVSHVSAILESVLESNREQSSRGGFQQKIRGWTRDVGGTIHGWAVHICRALTPCCGINVDTETQQTHHNSM